MGEEMDRWEDRRTRPSLVERYGNSGVVFAIVALALILAIGFFYLTDDGRNGRDDRKAEEVTRAAASIDNAAQAVGTAAKNAADGFQKNK